MGNTCCTTNQAKSQTDVVASAQDELRKSNKKRRVVRESLTADDLQSDMGSIDGGGRPTMQSLVSIDKNIMYKEEVFSQASGSEKIIVTSAPLTGNLNKDERDYQEADSSDVSALFRVSNKSSTLKQISEAPSDQEATQCEYSITMTNNSNINGTLGGATQSSDKPSLPYDHSRQNIIRSSLQAIPEEDVKNSTQIVSQKNESKILDKSSVDTQNMTTAQLRCSIEEASINPHQSTKLTKFDQKMIIAINQQPFNQVNTKTPTHQKNPTPIFEDPKLLLDGISNNDLSEGGSNMLSMSKQSSSQTEQYNFFAHMQKLNAKANIEIANHGSSRKTSSDEDQLMLPSSNRVSKDRFDQDQQRKFFNFINKGDVIQEENSTSQISINYLGNKQYDRKEATNDTTLDLTQYSQFIDIQSSSKTNFANQDQKLQHEEQQEKSQKGDDTTFIAINNEMDDTKLTSIKPNI